MAAATAVPVGKEKVTRFERLAREDGLVMQGRRRHVLMRLISQFQIRHKACTFKTETAAMDTSSPRRIMAISRNIKILSSP